MHRMASNPGEYEIKFLRKNRLSRSLKFTVGFDDCRRMLYTCSRVHVAKIKL